MDIIDIILLAIILMISIGLHEFAHAWMSHKLGDPTPKLQGRLTPNPLKHIDPVGFLLIFLIKFGWGKPVQVNPSYYKNPMKGELAVALAGPATNIILAVIGIFFLLGYAAMSGWHPIQVFQVVQSDLVIQFWLQFSYINIALAVFNMLPLPPLDGFRLVKMFFPKIAFHMHKNMTVISMVFLLIILLPGKGIIGTFISTVAGTIFNVIFTLLSHFF